MKFKLLKDALLKKLVKKLLQKGFSKDKAIPKKNLLNSYKYYGYCSNRLSNLIGREPSETVDSIFLFHESTLKSSL